MSDVKVDTVRSSSSGTIGRAVSQARGSRLVLDSSSHPNLDAFTNSEAFLGAISSCGVTLIETYARDKGIPMTRMEVTIEGSRTAEEPNRFASIAMSFAISGVSREQAEHLVETYRSR
ncbi:MAG TPA: OsmC family protein [Candidatus Methylomirabilis sp.]|nr:OsmC family protein [Candidatus Methylomirabilis sp.]